MKGNTQIYVAIAAIIAVVAGITFIANYSSNPIVPPTSDGKGTGSEPPLRFFALSIQPGPPISWAHYEQAQVKDGPRPSFAEFAAAYRRGRFQGDYELHAPGHYDFWFQNAHKEEAKISLRTTNCQCAGVEMGIVPPDAWGDFLQRRAVAALPLGPVPSALSGIAAADLSKRIAWTKMNM